jgi:hypothetical protein
VSKTINGRIAKTPNAKTVATEIEIPSDIAFEDVIVTTIAAIIIMIMPKEIFILWFITIENIPKLQFISY